MKARVFNSRNDLIDHALAQQNKYAEEINDDMSLEMKVYSYRRWKRCAEYWHSIIRATGHIDFESTPVTVPAFYEHE
jgi:hypothetical protein